MDKMLLSLSISYMLMTGYFFLNWLRFCLRRQINSPEDIFLSFVMCILTSLFWPIVIPMSCVESYKSKKLELSTVFPLVLAVFGLSLSFYLG
jgi:hypothetical protein